MNKRYILNKGLLLGFALLMLISCGEDRPFMERKVCYQAAEELAARLSASDSVSLQGKGKEKGKRMAIWPCENDPKGLFREALLISVSKKGSFEIYGVMEHDEMKKVLAAHRLELKYQDMYDPKYLNTLGRLIAPRAILVSRIDAVKISPCLAKVAVSAKLLDLKLGQVVWADEVVSRSASKKGLLSNVGIALAIVTGIVIFIFAVGWYYQVFIWIGLAVGVVVGLWFFIGQYLF